LQQSLSQELLENAGPAGAWAPLRQQHFAWLRPQDAGPAEDWANSCAKDAEDKTSARHAAISARIERYMSFFPSILLKAVYHVFSRSSPAREIVTL